VRSADLDGPARGFAEHQHPHQTCANQAGKERHPLRYARQLQNSWLITRLHIRHLFPAPADGQGAEEVPVLTTAPIIQLGMCILVVAAGDLAGVQALLVLVANPQSGPQEIPGAALERP
jgi:hypothetical protein